MGALETIDIVLLVVMAPLLICSAFFSAGETVLFSLDEADRVLVRRRNPRVARAVDHLLAQPRMLLITVLLCNMSVNTLYFVVGSVLSIRLAANFLMALIVGVATVLVIVILGEVVPKLLGASLRDRAVVLLAPALLTVHRVIGPLRVSIDAGIIAPLARLTAPTSRPRDLDEDELAAMLELSAREGVIDDLEQSLLQEVVRMRGLKVADVMTPRVSMVSIARDATRHEIEHVAERTRLSEVAVRAESDDSIDGLCPLREYLLDPRGAETPLADHVHPARFVPELSTPEHLLDHFRRTRTSTAIVVDEWGGTAGVVTIEDVVEQLVGDIVGLGEDPLPPPEALSGGAWRLSGAMHVDKWSNLFGGDLLPPRVRTVGGLFMDLLGREPREGDEISLGNLRCTVESLEGGRVRTAIVRLTDPASDDESAGDDA